MSCLDISVFCVDVEIPSPTLNYLYFICYLIFWPNREAYGILVPYLSVVCRKHWKMTVLSRSVLSNSLWPPWTVAHQAPLSMGILQTRILKRIAVPSFRGYSQPRNQTQLSCIAGGFFTIWATREHKGMHSQQDLNLRRETPLDF